jgi:uracil-DNA glycosylase
VRCGICPARYRCVLGDGPQDARVMVVGEAPGRDEDAGGRPFIGQAGREFNENYLGLAGLERDEVYVTNAVHCRPDLNRKPNPTEVSGCAGHFMPGELASVAPEVVVLMGATACGLVAERIDLEAEHGIPRRGELYGWSGWVVPIYHPAAGLHETSMMTFMLEDWELLRPWLEHGRWMWAESSNLILDYTLASSRDRVRAYFERYLEST